MSRGRAPLVRPGDERLVGGVAAGVARHVGADPTAVRLGFVGLALLGGFGPLFYAALWLAVPPVPAREHDPRAWLRRVARPETALLVVAAVVVLLIGGDGVAALPVPWPLLAAGFGAALTWRQADLRRRGLPEAPAWGVMRTALGVLLVAAAGFGVLRQVTDWRQLRDSLVTVAVFVVGVALVTGPFWLRTVQALTSERAARIRNQERADLAALVHDSVLQTLTLIQRQAHDPKAVQRYARRQERGLRELLYGRTTTGQFGEALERVAAEVEDTYGVTIEVVVVGDVALDERTGAVVDAAREAMVNAAKASGRDEFDVFAEVEPAEVTVFVRDRGVGFDPDAIPPDRFGLRESIVGRMQRAGGTARVRTAPGAGTEIMLSLGLVR